MNRIAVFIGTRPEFIKCEPLLASSKRYIPVFVEQHKDLVASFSGHKIQIQESGDNRLSMIVASILSSPLWSSAFFSVDAVLVQGDTAVAFAAALAAFHRGLPVIHLEAGLRTYNNSHPWPEEGYRRMIDTIATIGLCPSEQAAQHLRNEHFTGEIAIVGNTSIDAIKAYKLHPTVGTTVLVTLHRRENWPLIPDFFRAIDTLAQAHPDLTFILPMHPNPLIQGYRTLLPHVGIVAPLPHAELCELLASCNCVISDSGGIQEEAGWLGKRVYCCRETTERTELLQYNVELTPTPTILLEKFHPQTELLEKATCYGDGDTVIHINAFLDTKQAETLD
jgi:UDP-N-acetylglucosamine 2-epimerase (non-hydrolysing)